MISKEKIQAALDLASPEDEIKIRILHQATLENLKAYKAKLSVANLNNWKAAEKELAKFIDQALADDDDPTAAGESFANVPEIVAWLKRTGWKVAQSTVYKHKKAGYINPAATGRYSQAAVEAYAASYLQHLDGSVSKSEEKDLKEKRKAETRKATAQAESYELRYKIESGLYVPREAFERELATRARVLKSDLLSFCRSQPPEIIDLVSGDPEMAPDLVQFLVDQIETFLDRYAQDPDQVNLDA